VKLGRRTAATRAREVRDAGAELLFDVIATAYERTSVVLTTNLGFEQWPEVLGNERLTGAALDRLTRRCAIVETAGES
jgi:DNA replication protein DnaC